MIKLPSSADLGRSAVTPPGQLAVSSPAASQAVGGVADLQQVRSPTIRTLPAFNLAPTAKVGPVIEADTSVRRPVSDGGLGQIAAALGGFGEMLAREEDRIATIQADDAANKLAALRVEKTLQFEQIKGDKVLPSFVKDATEDFNTRADALGSSLPPKAQEKFLKTREAQKLGFYADSAKHATREVDAYEKRVNATTLETKTNLAINSRNDPTRYSENLADAQETLLKMILDTGVSQPERVAEQMQLQVSKIHARTAAVFVKEGEIDSAAKFIRAWGPAINPEDKADVVAEIQRKQELGAAKDMANEMAKSGSLSQQQARLEAMRQNGEITAERQDKVSMLLEKRAAEQKEAQTAYVVATKKNVLAKYDNDGNLDNVTAAEIKAVGPDFWDSVQAYAVQGSPLRTNWPAYDAIQSMLETAEGREEFKNEDLRGRFGSRIAPKEMAGLEKIQSALRTAADKTAAEEARVQAALDASDQQERSAIIQQAFRKGAGIGIGAKLEPEQAERYGVFFEETNNRIRDWKEANPKAANVPKDVVRDLAAKTEASQVLDSGGFFGREKKVFPSEVTPENRGRLSVDVGGEKVNLADIPDMEYKSIAAELRKRGLPVDDTTIAKYWLRGQGNK